MRCAGISSLHITIWPKEKSAYNQKTSLKISACRWLWQHVLSFSTPCPRKPQITKNYVENRSRDAAVWMLQGSALSYLGRKLSGAGNATADGQLTPLNLLRTEMWGNFQWKGTFNCQCWGPSIKSCLEWEKNWAKRAGVQFTSHVCLYLFAFNLLFQPCN